MKFFSMPADFKKETIDKYSQLNRAYASEGSRIIETYGNITVGNLFESSRPLATIPGVSLVDLRDYIEYSKQKGIDFNYTLNAINMQNREFSRKGILEIVEFLGQLYETGIRSLTIAMPTLIEIVQASKYDFKIKASTLCQVTNTTKAMAYKRKGVDKVVVDESINKNFHTLKRIRDGFGSNVEIIVNAICHKNCIYRISHYNEMAADSIAGNGSNEISLSYYPHRCLMQRYETVSDLLKLTWVRPEDLHYYTKIGIHHFKLQGRQAVVKGDPIRAVEAYFKESYHGDLIELLDMFDPTSSFRVFIDNKKLDGFTKPFFEKENFCKHDCIHCSYCDNFAKERIDCKKAGEIIQLTRGFIDEYDQFREILNSLDSSKNTAAGAEGTGQSDRQGEQMAADFDID